MPNRLATESSPYLLQHADNPVDWHPWGTEALQRARSEDKPVFLSIGYSACHWCHVMEHESFEDESIAASLNEHFICIKVDREERPDLDQIYMTAVQLLTGHGGWPMSVFLTPELQPFHGGTYWPPEPRRGMPGFPQVIEAVVDAWRNRRSQAVSLADQLTQRIRNVGQMESSGGQLNHELLTHAESQLSRSFDSSHGGFGDAPKFPHPQDLQLLLRSWFRHPRDRVLEMVTLTLDRMARGGIYDHLGGGFARYSVDQRWLVPHFEKMLYDNAQLATVYLDGHRATGNPVYARVARETLDYVLRDMTDELGGFYSSQDADSEGVEGKFYVWTPAEIEQVLGSQLAERFCYVYDVTAAGNFEGQNILHLPKTVEQCAAARGWDEAALGAELERARAQLLQHRGQRVAPGKDDKVLLSWNALTIDALARASDVCREPRYLQAAAKAADFILSEMRTHDARLLHTWRHGLAKHPAYLDDYAYLINALVTLYEACFDERWIDEADRLAQQVLLHFGDPDDGGFYFTADDHETLIARTKDVHDSSVPSGNAMAATGLWRLGKLCGNASYLDAAEATLQMALGVMQQAPAAAGQMLIALDMYLGPFPEVVVLGQASQPETAVLLDNLRQRYCPNLALSCRSAEKTDGSALLDPLYEGKAAGGAEPTVFICENFACQAPLETAVDVRAAWDRLSSAG